MTVSREALREADAHWAVQAVGSDSVEEAFNLSTRSYVAQSLGDEFDLSSHLESDELDLVDRVATAYEVAAMEGMSALLAPLQLEENEGARQLARAAAYRAFELRRVLELPDGHAPRAIAVLRLASLAYSADRWTDLQRWLEERWEEEFRDGVGSSERWDQRILFAVFRCWILLLRKEGWDDLSRVQLEVANLRSEQNQYESGVLDLPDPQRQSMALRLVALYHLAKATESLGLFMTMGLVEGSGAIQSVLDQHFDDARRAAHESLDMHLELAIRWLHLTARTMARGSVWTAASGAGDQTTRDFVELLVKSQSVLEFLPPQRAALQEQGLLDQASRAVVVDLPTSGGKTTLAQFRMLQALGQFRERRGWVAYVAPTKALVSQITRRLRRDFQPLGINVETLTSAVEIDALEEALLTESSSTFDVLTLTPEKLDLVIKGDQISRPLALLVVDEAHNIEDENRGLRLEFMLANVKRDCPDANFLLLMPYVSNAGDLARWLSPDSGKSVSLGTTAWQPNERLIGMFFADKIEGQRPGDWSLNFETLTTSTHSLELEGRYGVGGTRPLPLPHSRAKSLTTSTAAMASVMAGRGTCIAVARTIPDCWSMARSIESGIDPDWSPSEDVRLLQRFLEAEISPEFELIGLLESGIGVHHAGLPDEARALVEWLAESGELRVLCATSTISQGINFPVSSVFLATRQLPSRTGETMSLRSFWNLAGRAGRMGQDGLGLVGIAGQNDPDGVREYVATATGALASRLETLLDEIYDAGRIGDLGKIVHGDDWTDFRSYVAHLWSQKKNLEEVLAGTEQLLRNTLGYGSLDAQSGAGEVKAESLLEATREYARSLADHPENAILADSTGFSPDGVRAALLGLDGLDSPLTIADWTPESLFAQSGSALPDLVGIMLSIPQLSLTEVAGSGLDQQRIADITRSWVGGDSIETIAKEYFARDDREGDLTKSITEACKGLYRALSNSGSWGLSALSKMPTSGLDHEQLNESELRQLNLLPAMIYHGVGTESGILMRMNSVPRSVAVPLGQKYEESGFNSSEPSSARRFLRSMDASDWEAVAPSGVLSGEDYEKVWRQFSGETTD